MKSKWFVASIPIDPVKRIIRTHPPSITAATVSMRAHCTETRPTRRRSRMR